MRKFPLIFVACSILPACSGSPETDPVQPEATRSPVPAPAPTAPAATPAASPAAGPDAAPTTIPLDQGVYVLADVPCDNPPNAAFRRFDGKGFGGSATKYCRAEITGQQGQTYRIAHDCVDNYSNDHSTGNDSVTVLDRTRFTYADQGESGMTYRLCPALKLSDFGG